MRVRAQAPVRSADRAVGGHAAATSTLRFGGTAWLRIPLGAPLRAPAARRQRAAAAESGGGPPTRVMERGSSCHHLLLPERTRASGRHPNRIVGWVCANASVITYLTNPTNPTKLTVSVAIREVPFESTLSSDELRAVESG